MKLPAWVVKHKLLSAGIALLTIHLTIYTVQKTAHSTSKVRKSLTGPSPSPDQED
jgi:hypothetical protein